MSCPLCKSGRWVWRGGEVPPLRLADEDEDQDLPESKTSVLRSEPEVTKLLGPDCKAPWGGDVPRPDSSTDMGVLM